VDKNTEEDLHHEHMLAAYEHASDEVQARLSELEQTIRTKDRDIFTLKYEKAGLLLELTQLKVPQGLSFMARALIISIVVNASTFTIIGFIIAERFEMQKAISQLAKEKALIVAQKIT